MIDRQSYPEEGQEIMLQDIVEELIDKVNELVEEVNRLTYGVDIDD